MCLTLNADPIPLGIAFFKNRDIALEGEVFIYSNHLLHCCFHASPWECYSVNMLTLNLYYDSELN